MNLSPQWCQVFKQQGWEAFHWSTIGNPRASDQAIMDWAQANDSIVFTHDLDFGAILAATHAEGPSVIQVRTQDVSPEYLSDIVTSALHQHADLLEEGALMIIDEEKIRVRILPLNR
jgi:predicted nuclease of predicted toxin-antitoxin system